MSGNTRIRWLLRATCIMDQSQMLNASSHMHPHTRPNYTAPFLSYVSSDCVMAGFWYINQLSLPTQFYDVLWTILGLLWLFKASHIKVRILQGSIRLAHYLYILPFTSLWRNVCTLGICGSIQTLIVPISALVQASINTNVMVLI